MTFIFHKPMTGIAAIGAAALLSASPVMAQTTLTLFGGRDDASLTAYLDALVPAFEAANPDIKVEIEIGPGGTERDNMVKSRLATGTMTDLFTYNAGSLFQAINPTQTTYDLTGEPFLDNILDSFQQVVTAPDGTVRGVPMGLAMGGGVLYNRAIYEELGLDIPMTWDEFMANNEKIEEAGYVPVIQTYGTTWTSQLFVLADYFNVQAAEPDFATRYTNNEAKYATSDAAMGGFAKQQEIYDAGYLNEDFGAAVIEDGQRMLATGEAAHYPMLSFAIGVIGQTYPDNLDDIGFFALPGDDPASNGVTVWMPVALYISANTEHPEAAMKFAAFASSPQACEIYASSTTITGPFLIKGCEIPDDVPAGVAELATYFEADGRTAPALEFLSPIKGPNLENLTVEVGSGIRSALDAAGLYDEDVRKQAQQLGLKGW